MDLRKRRLGVLSYDDLLSRLAHALEDEQAPARQRMRDRWRFVLVDEFQDTDPVQWQVLDRAFSGEATMVLIGDPKQAIYAFRGGDVVTYLRRRGDRGRPRPRSAPTTAATSRCSTPSRPCCAAPPSATTGSSCATCGRPTPERRLAGRPAPSPSGCGSSTGRGSASRAPRGVPIGELRALVAEDLAADVRALLTAGCDVRRAPARGRRRRGAVRDPEAVRDRTQRPGGGRASRR